MKKNIAALLIALFFAVAADAQNTVSGKTDFFTGMAVLETVSEGNPFWMFSGSAKAQLDSSARDAVKTSIAVKYAVSNITAGPAAPVQSVNLERAFIKVRLPWINETRSRLSAGKMPLSWGYGMYFNAGDIIFGAAPSTLAAYDTNDFRIDTAWMLTYQMPFTGWFFAELAAVPPLLFLPPSGILDITGPVNETGGFGGRLVFEPRLYALQGVEAGYLAVDSVSKHRIYAALDGSVGADYNLCASIEIENSASFSEYGKKLALSAALFYTFYINGDVRDFPLTLRGEALYYPVAEKMYAFSMISCGFSDNLSASLMYLNSVAENLYSSPSMQHMLSASVVWTPLKHLQLVVQGALDPDAPRRVSSVSAGCVYSF